MTLIEYLDKEYGQRYRLLTKDSDYSLCWITGKNNLSIHYITVGRNEKGDPIQKHASDTVKKEEIVSMSKIN